MSEHHDYAVHSEPETLPGRPIAGVLAATCVVALLCVGVAAWLLDCSESSFRPSGAFSARDITGAEVVEGLETTLIADDHPAAATAAAQRARLQSYGWVDEGAGVAHIPIEAAFDALLGEEDAP